MLTQCDFSRYTCCTVALWEGLACSFMQMDYECFLYFVVLGLSGKCQPRWLLCSRVPLWRLHVDWSKIHLDGFESTSPWACEFLKCITVVLARQTSTTCGCHKYNLIWYRKVFLLIENVKITRLSFYRSSFETLYSFAIQVILQTLNHDLRELCKYPSLIKSKTMFVMI